MGESQASLHARAVRKAAALVGGTEALAARLGVPSATVGAWLAGDKQPTFPVLLRIVEVILDETGDGRSI
jgi:DNA-binding transcriptional regulator YiaG